MGESRIASIRRAILQLSNRFLQGAFFRNVVILAGGTALGQAIVVAISPLLTRLYSVEDFGIFSVYISILSMVAVIAGLRYELAIPLPAEDEDARDLLVVALGITLSATIVFGIALLVLSDTLIEVINVPGLRDYLWALPIGFFFVGTSQIFIYWGVRKAAFREVASSRVGQGIGSASSQIVLGSFRVGAIGLLIGDVMGRLASTALMLWSFRKEIFQERPPRLGSIRAVAVRYRRFPQVSSIASLINSAGLRLPTILLAAFFGPQVAGWFGLSLQVIGAPVSLIGRSVAQVYYAEAAEAVKRDVGELRRLLLSTTARLSLMALVPTIILGLAGPRLFAIVFGDQWGQAGVFGRVLSVMFLFQFAISPVSQTLNIMERQELQLIWDILRLLLVVVPISLGSLYGLAEANVVALYSAFSAGAYILLFVFVLRVTAD